MAKYFWKIWSENYLHCLPGKAFDRWKQKKRKKKLLNDTIFTNPRKTLFHCFSLLPKRSEFTHLVVGPFSTPIDGGKPRGKRKTGRGWTRSFCGVHPVWRSRLGNVASPRACVCEDLIQKGIDLQTSACVMRPQWCMIPRQWINGHEISEAT